MSIEILAWTTTWSPSAAGALGRTLLGGRPVRQQGEFARDLADRCSTGPWCSRPAAGATNPMTRFIARLLVRSRDRTVDEQLFLILRLRCP